MLAVWTFLFGIVQAVRKQKRPNMWGILFLGLFYGMLIEILQFALPTNRSPEIWDFVADAIGVGFAVFLLKLVFNQEFKDEISVLHDDVIT